MATRITKAALVSWDTDDEIDFIRGLGKHTANTRHRTRLELLEGYKKGVETKNWKGLDKKIVLDYLNEAIAMERRDGTTQAR
jgi:hypothetical protein